MSTALRLSLLALSILPLPAAAGELPDAIAAPGEVLIATTQAVGAQVYECKTDDASKLVWQFREPIATLFIDGKTVGRHYAGPVWEMADGSAGERQGFGTCAWRGTARHSAAQARRHGAAW
jgi:hypothetical protein